MKDIDAAWLAAAIDGEGWIWKGIEYTQRKTPYPKIHTGVCNTNEAFIKKAAELMNSSVICGKYSKSAAGHFGQKPIFRTNASGHKKVLAVLESVYPYLIIKKEKAKEMIDFIKSRRWGLDRPEGLEKRILNLKQARKNPIYEEKRLEGIRKYWTNKKNMGVV